MNLELNQDNNIKEIIDLIRNSTDDDALRLALEDYHDKDLAEALEELSAEERKKLYRIIGPERTGEVFSFVKDDVDTYINEISINEAAKIVEEMDTDDAVDLLEQVDDTIEEKLLAKMDDKVEEEIRLIQSYDDDELGSLMTTNFIKLNISTFIKLHCFSCLKIFFIKIKLTFYNMVVVWLTFKKIILFDIIFSNNLVHFGFKSCFFNLFILLSNIFD